MVSFNNILEAANKVAQEHAELERRTSAQQEEMQKLQAEKDQAVRERDEARAEVQLLNKALADTKEQLAALQRLVQQGRVRDSSTQNLLEELREWRSWAEQRPRPRQAVQTKRPQPAAPTTLQPPPAPSRKRQGVSLQVSDIVSGTASQSGADRMEVDGRATGERVRGPIVSKPAPAAADPTPGSETESDEGAIVPVNKEVPVAPPRVRSGLEGRTSGGRAGPGAGAGTGATAGAGCSVCFRGNRAPVVQLSCSHRLCGNPRCQIKFWLATGITVTPERVAGVQPGEHGLLRFHVHTAVDEDVRFGGEVQELACGLCHLAGLEGTKLLPRKQLLKCFTAEPVEFALDRFKKRKEVAVGKNGEGKFRRGFSHSFDMK